MIQRCHNPKHARFADYGGKGIEVCERWREDFRAFLSDMGERPDGMTIDRIDNQLGYERGNCRWATTLQQQRNLRATQFLTVGTVTKSLNEWSDDCGVRVDHLKWRIRNGWAPERVILPSGKAGSQRHGD
jgi:hypothetical protein